MAGLNCGTPSAAAWPIIKNAADAFIAIEDHYAEEAIRAYYYAASGDIPIVSCESGASSLAGLIALCRENALKPIRDKIGLPDCSVLLVNTEGDTDPVNFNRIIN